MGIWDLEKEFNPWDEEVLKEISTRTFVRLETLKDSDLTDVQQKAVMAAIQNIRDARAEMRCNIAKMQMNRERRREEGN